MIRAFRQANFVVFLVVLESVLFPCHRATGVFFVNAVAVLIGVVAFTVARRVRTVIGVAFLIPRVKAFSKLLQNSLTGLAMQTLVFNMVFTIGDFAGFVPDVVGMVVADVVRLRLTGSQTASENVPEFTGAPPMPVERLCNL